MSPEQWALVITAVGGFQIVKVLVDGLRARKTGRATAQRDRNRALIDDAERAESRRTKAEAEADAEGKRADREARRRRLWEAYAGDLRWLLLQCGMPPHRVPPWPDHDSDYPPE